MSPSLLPTNRNPRGTYRSLVRADGIASVGLVLSLMAFLGQSASPDYLSELSAAEPTSLDRPNVILVMTDDQGYGDIGAHGNEMIRTPHLDRLHHESVRLTNFHVDPTCSPTRAALMTGRYSTRSGVWHTIQGRSLMSSDETTLADMFLANGYRTGLFGKWHLGDNAPLRPQDRGFQRAVYHGGGGITQTPDWWGNDYFDDVYFREDGSTERYSGYCTDVWFREAMKFIKSSAESGTPFFCYLSTNAPHGPFLVADEYKQPYLAAGVPEPMASFYGMITNIDDNMQRLMTALEDGKLAENTILIFMSDNGTAAGVARPNQQANWRGFNAGMRGQKGSEYDGGHRVPCFLRWPRGKLTGGRDVDQLTTHIDLLPTLVDLCGLNRPDGPTGDGVSLVPILHGDRELLRDRTLFVHSQRVAHVIKWRKSAVMTDRWRLINGQELYDIRTDPGQQSDIASSQPELVEKLRDEYERWWDSLTPAFDRYVRIDLGSDRENPASLTCHDWHNADDNPLVPWNQQAILGDPESNGFWAVNVTQPGVYEFTLRMRPKQVTHTLPRGMAKVRIADREFETRIAAGVPQVVVRGELPSGETTLQTWLQAETGSARGAYFVEVRRVD